MGIVTPVTFSQGCDICAHGYRLTIHKTQRSLRVAALFLLSLVSVMLSSTPASAGNPDQHTPLGVILSAAHEVEGALKTLKALADCGTDPWVQEAHRVSLDPMLIYSMALTESRMQWSDGWVRPCPYCVRVGETRYRPETKEEAVALVREGVGRGQRITDVGVMQVNASAHKERVDGHIERLLDVRTNIAVGADILAEALNSTPDFNTGLGRYHSWTPRFGKPYGDVAARRYRLLKQATKGTLWPQCSKFAKVN